MTRENAEERTSESIFGDAAESTGQDEQARCLACRVWWKVAIVLVLVAAIVGVIANKQRGNDLPEAGRAGAGAGNQLGQDQGPAAHGGAEENSYGPETILATVNGEKITLTELGKLLEQMPQEYAAAFKNNKHELLEQLILRELLLQEARAAEATGPDDTPPDATGAVAQEDEDALLDALLRREVLDQVTVTEEDLRRAYEELQDELPEHNSFQEVKDDLQKYVRQEKHNKAIESYLAKLRERATISRNEDWVEAQKARASDNPLDSALATGRPVVADFGRGVCIPCKMMKPILDKLQEEYKGRAEILIIEIDEYPALTQRVGVRAIPTQIFYDAEGNEVYRHQGFMPRDAIVEKLREMGVK